VIHLNYTLKPGHLPAEGYDNCESQGEAALAATALVATHTGWRTALHLN